jgi:PKD repeat protein
MRRLLFAILFLWVALVRTEGQTISGSGGGAQFSSLSQDVNIDPPPIPSQLSWFGAGYATVFDAWLSTAQLKYFPVWGIGVLRDFFGQGGNNTNEDTFAWSKVQLLGSNDWEWGNADMEMGLLTNFNDHIIVAFAQGAYTTHGPGIWLSGDPPWAANLTTQEYAIAKGNFINAFAQRYGSNQWHGTLYGIEPENEPDFYNNGMSAPIRHLLLLSNSQPARAYCKLIACVFPGPNTNHVAWLVSQGVSNLIDGVSWHYYTYSTNYLGQPSDPSVTPQPMPNNGWYPYRSDQYMNWLHTQFPPTMPIFVTEFGLNYLDLNPAHKWVPMDPQRVAKAMIMLEAGGAASINIQEETPTFFTYAGGGTPDEIATLSPGGAAAVWTAYWLQNQPFSGLVSNGNAFAYSFGEGPNMVTLAWTFEGTNQAYAAANYTAMTDLYGNELSVVTNLTSDVIVLLGEGTMSFTMFNASPTYGSVPMTVKFTDLSGGGITNRFWQFGDGFVTNTPEATVVHRYTTPGTNTVQLIVSTPGGDSTNAQSVTVIVTPFPPPLHGGGINGLPPITGAGTNSAPPSDSGANSNWRFLIGY